MSRPRTQQKNHGQICMVLSISVESNQKAIVSNCVTHKACHIKLATLCHIRRVSHKDCHTVSSTQRITPGLKDLPL